MDADWDELCLIQHPGPTPNALPTPIITFAFDNSQELLWVGNQYGRIMSFYGPELQRYTSYKGHTNEPVKQILFHDKGVLSISAHSVHLASRTGPAIWHLTDERFQDLQCMSFTSKGVNELLVAGCQETMFKIDVEKGAITQVLEAEDNYTLMKRGGQYICAANTAGTIHILDPGTFQIVKVWQAHSGMINDMDSKSDFLVTCGRSPRQQHGLMLDPLANVFDLKTLMPLPPIPFQPGAAFVRMHPKMSTTSIVASQTGQLQVVDIMNPHTVNLKQAHIYDTTYLTGLELAPSGEALALASSLCQIHLWGSPSRLKFAEYSNPTLFPDTLAPLPMIDWSLDTPLNSIGMPYYREVLLSAWPTLISEVGGMPPRIDPDITSNLKRGDIGYFAPNLQNSLRNQVEYGRIEDEAVKTITAPKFLSEKARDAVSFHEEGRRMSDALDSLTDMTIGGTSKRDVPLMYRNVEIKYSRFGVDDFDFEFYNKTEYSGLETHIANSYANPLLQLYRFIPIIRNLALHHTSTACLFDNCLLCELGFLIDMLEKAAGQNCQASNFLKTFSGQSAAASLNLLEENSPNSPLTAMIQSVNRFLLDKFCADFRQVSPHTRYLEQALATNVTATIRCAHCTHEQMRPESPFVHDLVYPTKSMLRNQPRGMPRLSFSQILKTSVERQDQTRGWCPRCKRYQQLNTRKSIQSVPSVFMINAAIGTSESKHIWATPDWLPQEIGIIVDQGQFYCYEGQDLALHIQRGVYNVQVYELIGVVTDVNSGENQKPHLVSLINVAASSSDPDAANEWHLFNDFLVRQTTEEDALRFDPSWKLPSVLAYQLKSASHLIDETWKETLDTSILYRLWSPLQDEDPDRFRLLSTDEAPQPGTPVGIDAEFVSMQSEEIEIKADGTRETVRPSRWGLARVSVVRGDGPSEDLPFIDDYIVTSEPIVDYLTAFSGISPGDLDPAVSKHVLVSLKVAYKKLWLLLNLGCIFVGHGLLKDFRTINIHVPRGQVVDTVDLWYIKARARKLNLRFLAWLLLKEDIQSDMHDSIEDARAALRLWRKYLEVQSSGKMEETLEWIYRKGREIGYKAPNSSGQTKLDGGRDTPDPTVETQGDGLAGAGTPIKRLGFGAGKMGFGSPLR